MPRHDFSRAVRRKGKLWICWERCSSSPWPLWLSPFPFAHTAKIFAESSLPISLITKTHYSNVDGCWFVVVSALGFVIAVNEIVRNGNTDIVRGNARANTRNSHVFFVCFVLFYQQLEHHYLQQICWSRDRTGFILDIILSAAGGELRNDRSVQQYCMNGAIARYATEWKDLRRQSSRVIVKKCATCMHHFEYVRMGFSHLYGRNHVKICSFYWMETFTH